MSPQMEGAAGKLGTVIGGDPEGRPREVASCSRTATTEGPPMEVSTCRKQASARACASCAWERTHSSRRRRRRSGNNGGLCNASGFFEALAELQRETAGSVPLRFKIIDGVKNLI